MVMASDTDPYGWVEAAASASPARVFLTTAEGHSLSYAGLHEAAGRWSGALSARGVVAGDRVAAQIDKSAESVLLYVACLRMGAVYVPINTANSDNEVEYFVRDAQPRVVVLRPGATGGAAASLAHVETLGTDGSGSLAELAGHAEVVPAPRAMLPASALAAIVYTSGTTGRSKGAMLTRGNLASNAATLADAWHFTPADVLLHMLPLFHVHGLFAAINTVLASGSSMLLAGGFDAQQALRHFGSATVFMGVPTYYTRLLQMPGLNRESTANVRLFVSGSAPLLAETHHEFERRTGHVILERYGMTETLMNTSNPYEGLRLPGSVGPPLRGIEVRVVDASTGRIESAAGAVGTLEIRGPNVCAGYWRDPAKTASEFTSDGWFKTGDVGCIDERGYVHIVGRAKDLVITGGYNVYPKEVETELDALPGVLESAVIGVAHPDFGEGVTAIVVARAGAVLAEAELVRALQARVARYKVPKRVIVVAELPRNAMGKVQKNILRQTYATLYQGG